MKGYTVKSKSPFFLFSLSHFLYFLLKQLLFAFEFFQRYIQYSPKHIHKWQHTLCIVLQPAFFTNTSLFHITIDRADFFFDHQMCCNLFTHALTDRLLNCFPACYQQCCCKYSCTLFCLNILLVNVENWNCWVKRYVNFQS